MTKLLDIDVQGISDVSGAINSVYLVPTEERDSGTGPLVCVSSSIGSGMPERAYHRRWQYLGKVSPQAVPESVISALEACQETLLAIADLYEGHQWDGHNQVGQWRQDEALEREMLDIQEALSQVSTYTAASDYFAPLGNVNSRMRELATQDSLDAVVAHEVGNTVEDQHLDEADVRQELLNDAETWLAKHGDEEGNEALRARLEGWLEQ